MGATILALVGLMWLGATAIPAVFRLAGVRRGGV